MGRHRRQLNSVERPRHRKGPQTMRRIPANVDRHSEQFDAAKIQFQFL